VILAGTFLDVVTLDVVNRLDGGAYVGRIRP
jgi:hypothetical protein